MARIPNKHGGDAQINRNGLHFEQTTSLNDALFQAEYEVKYHVVFLHEPGKCFLSACASRSQAKTVYKFLTKELILMELTQSLDSKNSSFLISNGYSQSTLLLTHNQITASLCIRKSKEHFDETDIQ